MGWPRARQLAALALVFAAYTALYARVVSYNFVWDDVLEIEHNAAFSGSLVDGLAMTQTERTDPDLTQLASIQLAYDSYRPLLFASYWIDIRLWGRAAGPLHVMNLVFGALAILAAYAVARRLCAASGGSPVLPVVVAALFALHPVQVETIAYISGRGDLLAGLFALVATYASLRAAEAASRSSAAGWLMGSGVAFAASLLCKEACLGLPIVIAASAWAAGALRARTSTVATLFGVALAYLVLRRLVVVGTTGGALGDALLGLPSVWLEYLQIALLPFDLSIERVHRGALTPAGWAIAIIAVAALGYRARTGVPWPSAARFALVGAAWFTALIGPAAVAVTSSGVASDRYLYAPWFGLALALTVAMEACARARPKLRRPIIVAAAVWGALLFVVAWRQIPVWHDNRALYTHAVAMEPDSSLAQYRLAFLDAQAGNWDDAIPRLEQAVALDPHNFRALNNLGVGYLRSQQYPQAETALAHAVEANPAHFRSWLNLGAARLALGKRDTACADIARALQINPGYSAARAEQARSCPVP